MKTGLSALINCGAWLSHHLDLEVMGCSQSGEAIRLELTGRFLAYDITLDQGLVSLSAQLMDQGDAPELLLKVGDTLPEWQTVCKLITALERNQIKALSPKPLEIGEGCNGFVIG
jgi:hypothetical protein